MKHAIHRHAIHIEGVQDGNQQVMLVEAEDMRAALHKAADRLIANYGECYSGDQPEYLKRQRRWTGSPHPQLVIEVSMTRGGRGECYEDLDVLTACPLEEIE